LLAAGFLILVVDRPIAEMQLQRVLSVAAQLDVGSEAEKIFAYPLALGGIPNAIFECAISLRQLCRDHIGSPRRINPARRIELNGLAEVEFVHWFSVSTSLLAAPVLQLDRDEDRGIPVVL
jgi:hypothetical protein